MPRRIKELPDRRADYSFGDLLYWHLFVFGTRPNCDPTTRIGRPWEFQGFCALIGISDRTLWNWILDRNLPDDLVPVDSELFGDNPQLHDWRIELWRAWRAGRLTRASKVRFGMAQSEESEEAVEDMSAFSDAENSRTEDDGDDGEIHLPARYSPEEQETHDGPVLDLPAYRREEAEGGSHESRGGPIDLVMLQRQQKKGASARPRANRRRAAIGFLVPGIMLLLGVYSWSRPSPTVREKQVVQVPPKPEGKLPQKPEEKKSAPTPVLTDQERRAAEERRLKEKTIDAMKAGSDAEQRAREQEAIRRDQEELAASHAYDDREFNRRQLAGMGYRLRPNASASGTSIGVDVAESINDCGLKCLSRGDCDGFAYYRDQKVFGPKQVRSCYFFKRPLQWIGQPSYDAGEKLDERSEASETAPPANVAAAPTRFEVAQAGTGAVTTPEGVVQCSGEPVKVTGFRIICDKLIVGGSALGSTQLRYSVANINECAAKCRPVSQCGGFAYKSMAYQGKHDCEIMGPTKNMNDGKGWISAVR